MDVVHETPTKRRKTESGHVGSGRAYDSQDDSGDDLFQGHETVATVPVPSKISLPPSSPPSYISQPTQIIEKDTPSSGRKPSIIQIAASSPARPSANNPPANSASKNGRALASMMAPAGTTFRPPLGVQKPAVIDLSDDEGPTYKGGPSDDESQQNRRDIKPSTFVHSSKERSASGGISRFREITAGAIYRPLSNIQSKGQTSNLKGSVYDSRNRDDNQTTSQLAGKRSADTMANAYGNARRTIKEPASPAKAKSTKEVEDIALEDIEDYQLRVKVERMRAIWPMHTVTQCRDALFKKKCNFDDAVELLSSQAPQAPKIDLTISDEEDKRPRQPVSRKKNLEKVRAPVQSIQERWTSTQLPKPPQASESSPLLVPEPPKQRKRLVQGQRRPTSPVQTSPVASAPPLVLPKRRVTPEPQDSDSGVASGEEDGEDKTGIGNKVLEFFNTCSVADLEDIAGITTKVATILLSQKPFASLSKIKGISGDVSTATSKKSTKKPIGEKILGKCMDMWTGYEAVDELVKHCEDLGKPIADEMNKWGVDVYGGSKDGELDLVRLEHASPGRDSGIGTPTSGHVTDEDEGDVKKMMRKKPGSLSQPKLMGKDVELKDYQIVGVNWLSLLFDRELSCILADDMGLGKTCQVIAFLAHLKEKGVQGPHLIVVPASTLENWLREFSVFCPKLEVMPFYAELKEREEVRQQILDNIKSINVIVTTYGMAKRREEAKFLRQLQLIACVYDEGHTLKNSTSAGYQQLIKIPAKFRLLLTGTPLQNNLRELMSLLGFILPKVFQKNQDDLSYIFSHKAKTTDDNHAALLSVQRIARAKAMMTPFVLRRKKHQVLKHLPTKTRRVEYCEMSAPQVELYEAEKARAAKIIQDRAAGIKTGNDSANIIMNLRKASIHPLLFRRLYTDATLQKMSKACLKESEFAESNPNLVFEDMSVMTDHELHVFCETYPKTMSRYILPPDPDPCFDSGKITALNTLLKTYIANGDRVLIFSQFVLVLNLLVPVLESLGIEYSRLDGKTSIAERQPLIDNFTHSDPPIPVFLLSTKAGGAGINLACANKVVIFDSSFNPQDDIQAENRAHRVGQKREVEVVRLVSKETVEEAILALGETKVALDERVAGVGEGDEDKKAEKEGLKRVEELVFDELKGEEKAKRTTKGKTKGK